MRRHLELALDELPILPRVAGGDGRAHDVHLFAHGSADLIVDAEGDWQVSEIYLETSEALALAGGRLSRRFTRVERQAPHWDLIEQAIRRQLGARVDGRIAEGE
ncbi:hypothetical protein [Phreatobacter stygius]|uniref:Uncharacterized protein n=1 Tax=Phreatobacter stygius TaxID=1940610 RepID=A0A4D7B8Q2_9HYPH|nr:hypothetical protein [Phreatobacter stygius]QCI67223.1 hypothetical protein E8M01_25110 [Phreatobacter stygius]